MAPFRNSVTESIPANYQLSDINYQMGLGGKIKIRWDGGMIRTCEQISSSPQKAGAGAY
jgi:hypothetical protein